MVNVIVRKGSKYIIPLSLLKYLLQKIHKGHLVEVKYKRRAKEVFHWPRINQDISQTTAVCEICLTYRPKQQAELLLSHPAPRRLYYKVRIDEFDCDRKSYIMVTVYFSTYPEVGAMESTSSKAVISFLKTVFTRHCVRCEMFLNNGPQCASGEFAAFGVRRSGVSYTLLQV